MIEIHRKSQSSETIKVEAQPNVPRYAPEYIERCKREHYADRVEDGFIPKERCVTCGGTSFFYFHKNDVRGNMLIKAMCENCGRTESARLAKNSKKRCVNQQTGWRYRALERAGYKCQICGSVKDLNVHHIIPVCVAPQFIDNDGNAAVVCRECHEMIHRCDDWSRADENRSGEKEVSNGTSSTTQGEGLPPCVLFENFSAQER